MPATEGKTEGSIAVASKLSCQYEMCSEKRFSVGVAIKRVKKKKRNYFSAPIANKPG